MREQTDLELVGLAQGGDADAYGRLFERHQSKIYNFAYSILGQAEDARDVTQDAFVRVFEALPGKQDLDFSPYLYRTARNLSYDVARARGRYIGDPETTLDAQEEKGMDADPERSSLFREQQDKVREAVTALSADYRAVLTMREIDELSYQQIADALGMPRNTVGVMLSRARLKFRGAFRMQYVDADKLAAECKDMLPKLSAYLDEELSPAERAKVDDHLDGCPLCRLALDEMREATKSYRALIPLVPPVAIRADVFSRLPHLGGTGGPAGGGGGADGSAGTGGTGQGGGGAGAGPSSGSSATAGGYGGGSDGADGMGSGGPGADTEVLAQTHAGAAPEATAKTMSLKKLLSPKSPVLWLLLGAVVVVLALLAGVGITTGWGRGQGSDGQATVATVTPSAPISPVSITSTSGVVSAEDSSSAQEPASTGANDADTDAPPRPGQLSPEDGALVSSDRVTLRWESVSDPSGVTYRIEVQQWIGGGEGWQPYATSSGEGTSYRTDVPLKIRWRVRASDGAGNRSSNTGWWIVVHAADEGGSQPSTDPTVTPSPTTPILVPGNRRIGTDPSTTPSLQ